MRFQPEITILAQNDNHSMYVIEIPAGVRNPNRTDERHELNSTRYALVADGNPASVTGPLPFILNLFEQHTQAEDEDY